MINTLAKPCEDGYAGGDTEVSKAKCAIKHSLHIPSSKIPNMRKECLNNPKCERNLKSKKEPE